MRFEIWDEVVGRKPRTTVNENDLRLCTLSVVEETTNDDLPGIRAIIPVLRWALFPETNWEIGPKTEDGRQNYEVRITSYEVWNPE